MLMIIMHNNQRYLEYVADLATQNEIFNFTIVKRRGIGVRLFGGDANFVLSRGLKIEAYEKAFVALIDGEEKTKHFLDIIENDNYLERTNMQDKGFVCTVPFFYISKLLKLYQK